MSAIFRVLSPGLASVVQDSGRHGYLHLGVTHSGTMDAYSFTVANQLLGQEPNCPAIEILLGNAQLLCLQDCQIALTGARRRVTIDDQQVPMWNTLHIRQGQILRIDARGPGRFIYLAIRAELKLQHDFDSCASVPREQLGANNGLPLAPDDELCGQLKSTVESASVPFQQRSRFPMDLAIGLIPGFQYRMFDRSFRRQFFARRYVLDQASDRMGYRLQGAHLAHKLGQQTSEGVCEGAVQVPNDGNPIVMMRDHQTLGGYPKLGTVAQRDISRLAQALPGTRVQFYLLRRSVAAMAWKIPLSKVSFHNLLS